MKIWDIFVVITIVTKQSILHLYWYKDDIFPHSIATRTDNVPIRKYSYAEQYIAERRVCNCVDVPNIITLTTWILDSASADYISKTHLPRTKWPLFRRRHYRTSIGSGSGLSPVRRQVITWTNADPVDWRIYAVLGGMSLRLQVLAVEKHIRHVKIAKYSSAYVCT